MAGSPLRVHSVQLGVVKGLDSDEVTFHEAPMTIQGEAQPGNVQPMYLGTARLSSESQLVVVEEHVANRITCGFVVAERQQDYFRSLMAAGAREAAREETEGGEERRE